MINLVKIPALAVLFFLAGCHVRHAVNSEPSGSVPSIMPGQPGDPNIHFIGRWDFSNPDEYAGYWGGSYLQVKFTGKTVKLKVGKASSYYAKIDDGPWVSYKNVNGIIDLTPVPLKEGKHLLRVAQGKDYDYVFLFRGLLLDKNERTLRSSTDDVLIEWIGDSITAGYTDEQANVSGFPWVCSEALGAEHTQIAFPGICLTSGFPNEGMDVYYLKSRSKTFPPSDNWDFKRYTPGIIVINLGTNDNNKKVPDEAFEKAYSNLLDTLRAKFPVAEIFMMQTFRGVKTAPTLAAFKKHLAAGDKRLHYIRTEDWLTQKEDFTDGLHPSVSGNIKAAGLLREILKPYAR